MVCLSVCGAAGIVCPRTMAAGGCRTEAWRAGDSGACCIRDLESLLGSGADCSAHFCHHKACVWFAWALCSAGSVPVAQLYSSARLAVVGWVHPGKMKDAWGCSQECSSNVEHAPVLLKCRNVSWQRFGPCQQVFF